VATGVWELSATARGIVIEDELAATEYASWYRVGGEVNGKFEMVDFQQGNTLVSLKTADTVWSSSRSWFYRLQDHINELATRPAFVNGQPAKVILDIRVPPGGAEAAQPLVEYGRSQGVTVIVKEFMSGV
jgi:filamentous hemagglutinin